MKSKYRPCLDHVKVPPFPTTFQQKLSHALPLPFHLLFTSIGVLSSVILAVIVYFIDGPLLESWNFITCIIHAGLKSLMKYNAPQGRHSFDLVRFFTKFKIPDWIFSNEIANDAIQISSSGTLSALVQTSLQLPPLRYRPVELENRILHGEWISNKEVESNKVVLYFHGGAHIFLSPNTHRYITTNVSNFCKAKVFALDYRLAPESPFPSAIEDALASYLALTKQKVHGVECSFTSNNNRIFPSQIFLMGDSSGACLVLQLLETLKRLDLSLPAGAILLSPFIDHEMKSESWHFNWNTDFMTLDPSGIEWALEFYANGVPRNHPVISPIHGSATDFPPILIQAGDSEVVTGDSIRYFKKLFEAGNQVQLQIFQHMFHVFQTFPFLKESRYAFERIDTFIASRQPDKTGSENSDNTQFEDDFQFEYILIDKHNQQSKINL